MYTVPVMQSGLLEFGQLLGYTSVIDYTCGPLVRWQEETNGIGLVQQVFRTLHYLLTVIAFAG